MISGGLFAALLRAVETPDFPVRSGRGLMPGRQGTSRADRFKSTGQIQAHRFMHAYQWTPISKNEGVILRAWAILAIVCHNYLHWISGSPGENEFTFRPGRIQALLEGLWNTPLNSVQLLASYFGHYGVQVFLFLSGYGLSIKYRKSLPGWWDFQKSRWASLYPAIIAAAIGFLIYDGVRLGWAFIFQTEGANLIRQILGISNFIPDNIYHPIGPWWFIGVILQFYLIVPTLLQWTHRYGNKVLIALALGAFLLEFFLNPVLAQRFQFNLNHSILGHLDVCVMGIWFARQGSFRLPVPALIAFAILFSLGNLYELLWIISGMTALFVSLPLLRMVSQRAQRIIPLNQCLVFVGRLSMYLFLCNGYLRCPLVDWANQSPHWWTSIWTCLVFLSIVFILFGSSGGLRKTQPFGDQKTGVNNRTPPGRVLQPAGSFVLHVPQLERWAL